MTEPATDPQNKPDTGTPDAAANQPAIDEAELEILREKAGRIDALDEIAREAQRDKAETYLNDLEDAIPAEPKEPISSPVQNGDKPTETKPPEPVAQPDAALMEQFKQGQQMTMQAIIKTHQLEFDVAQRALPEEERSTAKVADLQKMITGPESQLVGRLAPKFGGNLFAAANHIRNIEDGIPAARKAGAAAEAAATTAANTSGLPTGGATAEPKGPPTLKEAAAAENKKLADGIYPDARPYEHPDLQ